MLPKIGQVLYIQVESPFEEETQKVYKSRIADEREGALAIEIPIEEQSGRFKRLYTGDRLNAHFITEGGIKNYFHSEVLGSREDVIKQLVIEKPKPDSITKVQRRNYLRVPANLEMAVRLSDEIRFLARTDDISGGGLSFICDAKYPLEEKAEISGWLLIHFKNDTVDHVPFKGELVRVKTYDSDKQLGMMRFVDIQNADREKIIRYCFERQLELRKK